MGTIAFFKLHAGLLLGLYEQTNPLSPRRSACRLGPSSSTEFSLGTPAGSQARSMSSRGKPKRPEVR